MRAARPGAGGAYRRAVPRATAALAATLATALVAALGGCGGGPERAPPAKPWSDPGEARRGDWTLYYSVLRPTELEPSMARAYSIPVRADRALVSVSLVRGGDARPAADAEVTIEARTLLGQSRSVRTRRVERAGVVSWLGELDSAGRETLSFRATARLPGQPAPLVAEFSRELHPAD